MASLKDWTKGKNGKVSYLECFTDTLDSLIEHKEILKPDFIKCDIEGGEYDCFYGTRNLLDQVDSPTILFEANINSTKGYEIPIQKAMNFLSSLNNAQYAFYRINDDCSYQQILSIELDHLNIWAIPKSKLESLAQLHQNETEKKII